MEKLKWGACSSVVERRPRKAEASGSNPDRSTLIYVQRKPQALEANSLQTLRFSNETALLKIWHDLRPKEHNLEKLTAIFSSYIPPKPCCSQIPIKWQLLLHRAKP